MNKFLTIAILIMLALTSVSLFATKEKNSLPVDSGSGKAAIGGAFTLTDQHGKTVRETDFRGRDTLVFFGFTHCPEICPTTMATITRTMELLGDKAARIVPVFISIDPARDTPARLSEFMSSFDSRIVGLTGTDEQVKQVAAEYKAYYSGEGEMMNHSTLIYWMDKNGEYRQHFPYTVAPEELAAALSAGLE